MENGGKLEVGRYIVMAQESNRKTLVGDFTSYKSINNYFGMGDNDTIVCDTPTFSFGKSVIDTITIIDLKWMLHQDFTKYSLFTKYCCEFSAKLREE